MKPFIPNYGYHSIVLSPEKLRYNPCNDVIFPSVVNVSGLIGRPLGKYYMYYAPHDAPGGICLAYADDPTGPWIEYGENPIVTREWLPHYEVSHISSPHVMWVPAASKFFLYFHGENDTTRLATSSDGIHFEYECVCVTTKMYDRISEASYARVFPCDMPSRDASYVMLFMGNNEGTRRIYAAWSRDGKNFKAQSKPLVNPPPGTGVNQVGAPWYYPRDGQNFVLFHGDKMPVAFNDLTSDIYFADVGTDFTGEDHKGIFYPREDISPSNMRVSDPFLLHEDGRHWLFTAVGGRLNQKIALASEKT